MISILLKNVQHISSATLTVDIESPGIMCFTGKNGTGKTTLVKAFRNLVNSDTFEKTTARDIFSEDSEIVYKINDTTIEFKFDRKTRLLDTRKIINKEIRGQIVVELPIPHGDRFNHFSRISDADKAIRANLIVGKYEKPLELIEFLQSIYPEKSFDDLVEVSIGRSKYYCILLPGDKYLREDYFSSGEYFLINLYKKLHRGCKLMVVDEIDISLDAAAQVHLVDELKKLSSKYKTKFLFSTHSLPMMRKLKEKELFYLEYITPGELIIKEVPYSYVKSILFGFHGYDKYILTEDDVLNSFIQYIIDNYCGPVFYRYKIIHIGGSSNTTDLMNRNAKDRFLSDKENVITILDGDQEKLRHAKKKNVFCIPFDSIEKELLSEYLCNDYVSEIPLGIEDSKIFGLRKYIHRKQGESIKEDQCCKESYFSDVGKKLYSNVIDNRIKSQNEIFKYLCEKNNSKITNFVDNLKSFLRNIGSEVQWNRKPG